MSPILDVDGAANVNVVTTTETVVATLQGVNTRPGGSQVVLQGNCQFTTGASTTSVILAIRRGLGITGTLVGAQPQPGATAGATAVYEIQVDDNPGEVAGQSYVLTVRQIAATANGTAVSSNLRAEF